MKNPRNILITGASSGIGEALAVHYAAPGIFLALSGRDADRLQTVVELCRQRGAAVEGKVLCVTDRDAMRAWVLNMDRVHPLDLVIANAGISGGTGGGGESEDQTRMIFDVNVTGVFNTILPILPLMKARGVGQIAVMASLASFTGWPGAPAYSASKAAIRLYGEALRGSLRGSGVGVGVSVICPGFVESRMTAVNRYKMPFLMESSRAASAIAHGLAQDRARIMFPFPSVILAGLIAFLPLGLCHRILTRLPKKPSRTPDLKKS
ncbi:MAG: SDR family NAD(P)-dependent oxidoreductase [Micavibrio sp.]